MKLHDLRPPAGAHTRKTRVGRGIAAGKGKTAGRGTKGQKSRAGASIPPWFEGGQTPLHIRIPKLRGFRNINRIEYEVVNVGRISAAAEAGRIPEGEKGAPFAVTQEILRVAGLVSSLTKPLKILGGGEVSRPLFVVADAFTRSARQKIEAAGGGVQVLEIPTGPLAALGVESPAGPESPAADGEGSAPTPVTTEAKPAAARRKAAGSKAKQPADEGVADEPVADSAESSTAAAAADEPETADEAGPAGDEA
jgi:large subunit ribosomal protein L15